MGSINAFSLIYTLAQADSTGLDPWSVIQTGGIGGVLLFLVWMLSTGKFRTEKDYSEMRADRDLSRAELASLRQRMEEQVIPALVRVTDLMAELAQEGRNSSTRKKP